MNKNHKNVWNRLVDIVTIIWFISFILSFFVKGQISRFFDIFSTLICIFFIVDLIIIFKQSKSISVFFRKNWLDILLAIPFFRIFKVVRIAKIGRIGKFLKFLKKGKKIKNAEVVTELIDLSSKSYERIKQRVVGNGSDTKKSK